MSKPVLSPEQLAAYHRDGYVLVRSLFDAEEMDTLLQYAKSDGVLAGTAYGRKDAEGNVSRLALWNHPTDDLYGLFSRSPRLVHAAEKLLEDEVYHYHTKMMLKEPKVGGAWEWHQDYGYWYNNGCLYPLMLSCLIAVDRATRNNGCLQVLRGTHLMGRIDHVRSGEQTGADLERVEVALARHELIYIEAEPGDTLFFHCNLLHRSDANRSDDPRWSLICCYNAKRNDPYKESRHPRYSPLTTAPDDAIKQWREQNAPAQLN